MDNGKEYKFTFFSYYLTPEEAEVLRGRIEAAILPVVEAAGKYMSPVDAEPYEETGDGEEES